MAGQEFAMGCVNVIYDYTVGITRLRTNLMPSNKNNYLQNQHFDAIHIHPIPVHTNLFPYTYITLT